VPDQPPADPVTPTPAVDPALQQLTAQLKQMQEEIRKRDDLLQGLSKQLQTPAQQNTNMIQELADAKRQIEQLKESTSQLRRGQEDILALTTPEKGVHGLGSTTTHRIRERVGKWQEYLETPVSVSQRRSRRDTTRHSRFIFALVDKRVMVDLWMTKKFFLPG
jgi:septal ring factor EnvC (AmiA/AmiB activator)